MNKLLILTASIGLLMIAGWAYLFATADKSPTKENLPQTNIAVTIYPVFDIARQVAGDAAQVHVIVPPGASPHTYQPTPENIKMLQRSQALLTIGHELDDWAKDTAANAGIETIVILDKNLTLLTYEDDSADPHYWLSLVNAQEITRTIADQLIKLDPDNQAIYQDNAQEYIKKLQTLHAQALAARQNSPVTTIATFHDSWNYLARDYDLDIAATFETAAGQDPTPQDLQEFQQTLIKEEVQMIFAEPQFSSQKIEAIAADTNTRISYLDPLGGTIDKDTYLELMRQNINQIFKKQ